MIDFCIKNQTMHMDMNFYLKWMREKMENKKGEGGKIAYLAEMQTCHM